MNLTKSKSLDTKNLLATNIRLRRGILHISQESLAERAGLHRTYIGAIERGQQNVSIDNIEKIAIALGCSVSDLFQEQE